MILKEDEEIKAYHFQYLSLFRQLIVLTIAPFMSIIGGLLIYYFFIEKNENTSISSLLIPILIFSVILFFFWLMTKQKATKASSTLSDFKKTILLLISILSYLGLLASFIYYLESITPFINDLDQLLSGKLKYRNLTPDSTFSNAKYMLAFIGVSMGVFNFMPLAGLNGLSITNLFYEALAKEKISDRLIERYTLLTFPIGIFLMIWIIVQIFI